jgi:tetratricopeptide (TPR) repeat protein
MFIARKQFKEALSDANQLVRLRPAYRTGYDLRATCYHKLNEPEKALADYAKCIELRPDDHRSMNNRGDIYMNSFQKYNEALNEFTAAINIRPLGNYFLNRSMCYFKMNDITKAREDALRAQERGTVLTATYRDSLQLK